jgi:hypothetical protein
MKNTDIAKGASLYPPTKRVASGRWLQIIAHLAPQLAEACSKPGKHVPCPCHGSKDGFRLFENAADTGGGVCNQTGTLTNGFELLKWANKWSFEFALQEVANYLCISSGGSIPKNIIPSKKQSSDSHTKKKYFNKNSALLTTEDAKQAALQQTEHIRKQGYKPITLYTYTEVNGNPIYWKIRLDHPTKGKWIRPLSFNGSKWELAEPPFKNGKPLYLLHEIHTRTDEIVWIVEGEKCANTLARLGLLTTTSGSSTSADGADWSHLKARTIVIWPDNDKPGIKYAKEVTAKLQSFGCHIKWVDISQIEFGDGGDGGDGDDWITIHPEATKVDIEALPLNVPDLIAPVETANNPSKDSNQSELLDQIAASCELFHSPDRQAYATVPINSHFETWPIKSNGFIEWLGGKIYALEGDIPREQKINEFVSSLIGRAKYQGPEHPVHIRLAEADGDVYLDLADKRWGAVKITPDGWSLTEEPPVKFIRPNGMQPLHKPESGGATSDLARFINLSNDDDLTLLISCLTYYLNPTGPFPIIIIQGEQGSAKSTFSRIIRKLIDPSSAPLRSAPKNERDLMISAQNGWILVFDNLSRIPQDMSDALCRLSTGGGFSTRSLYSNAEECILQATRPICLNGITEFATKADLLDRSLIFKLSPIPGHMRKEEKVFWAEFDEVAPRILGLLLDGVSTALKNLQNIKLEELPRMADFAKFATATEEAFGWRDGSFMDAYLRNQETLIETSLEADPVAQAILECSTDDWWGTATELLVKLSRHAPDCTTYSKYWPKTASALSGRLGRLTSTFRKVGIFITFEPDGRGNEKRRIIRIKRVENSPSPASPPSPTEGDEEYLP